MKPIDIMHREFGIHSPPEKCKTCSNLIMNQRNRRWYKCSVWGESCCEVSDWRLKWDACGMYNKEYDWIPVKDYMKHRPWKTEDVQVEGQMELKL